MIRASRLRNLPVVDLDTAVKIGRVRELIVDPGRLRVTGLVIRRGGALGRGGAEWVLPGSAVHSVGSDALTVRGGHAHQWNVELAAFPSLSSLIGRQALSRRGRMLGTVDDILLDEETGRIMGYALDARTGGRGLLALFKRGGAYWPDYVRADADVRVGRHMIVAPDSALVQGERIEPLKEPDMSTDAPGWGERVAPAEPVVTQPSIEARKKRDRRSEHGAAGVGTSIPIPVNGSAVERAQVTVAADRM